MYFICICLFVCSSVQIKVEKAVDAKDRLVLAKLDEDDTLSKAKQELNTLMGRQKDSERQFTESTEGLKVTKPIQIVINTIIQILYCDYWI